MKSFAALCVLALLCGMAPAFALTSTSAYPDSPELVTTFSVPSSTKVPGKTLKAGVYSIRVVDHLADRVILQIEDANGKAETRFLGVPNAMLPHGSGTGPIPYAEAKHSADSLRGFAFPGGSTVEFVYAKEEAAGIAKSNGGNVLAIDPASEGRPNPSKLSKDDMEMVTLWTLSPTRIGPDNASQPAIQAQRYKAPQQPVPVQVAAVSEPALPPSGRANVAPPSSQAARAQVSAPHVTHSAKRPPVIAALPHTASELPLIFLSGIFLLGSAGVLRILRVKFSAH